MRLDRLVAGRLGWSRRQVAEAVRRGEVAVDGEPCLDAARDVGDTARISVAGEPLRDPPPRLALFHKPLGVHSTLSDPAGRPSLATAARELVSWGLHPVGRLDADTDGLLLFSSDGATTQQLLHPRRAVVRVYRARVEPPPAPDLAERLAAGVPTADGVFAGEVREVHGDRVTLAVTEGKHRMVRRMLANAGHPVIELRRLSYGPFQLGDLAAGAWRLPSAEELSSLSRIADRRS